VPQHGGERARGGRDRRVGLIGRPAGDLEPPAGHVHAEALIAEAQLVAGVHAVGGCRVEERLQRDHERVVRDLRLARRERGDAAPAPERDHDRLELAPTRGQLVDARAGRWRQRAAAHDARLLELLEPLGQDVGADVGKPGAQVGEALGPEEQLAHDEQRPALAHEVERAGHAAAVAVRSLRRHADKSSLSVGHSIYIVGFSN
jgi:hypothetical protein